MPDDADRFHHMAECYDALCDRFVPHYDWLQEQAVALLGETAGGLVVDLGGGGGRFLEKVLDRSESARAVWVDFSADFEAVARRRLARFGPRVTFVRSRLEEPWEQQLPAAPTAIASMSAIHHLETAGKQELHRRCFDALAPGGWFTNIDEMSTLYEDAYHESLTAWVRHVDETRAVVPAELREAAERWCERFDGWKRRNLAPAGPKQAGDDIHEGYVEQVRWLREAGFVACDLYCKYRLWSVIGGRKPG